MGIAAILLITFLLGMYWLYCNGYLAVQSKQARIFVGSMGMGRDFCHATFHSCTGYVWRVLKCREEKVVTFTLGGNIEKGSVKVFLLDRHRQVLLALSTACPTGQLPMTPGVRYYLRVEFQGADGNYWLNWR